MPPDLVDLCRPGRAALVTQECQVAVIGAGAMFPALVDAAATTVIPNGSRLLAAARAAAVPVVHCVAMRRTDGLGTNTNAKLFAVARKSSADMTPGSAGVELVPEFGPAESDVVLSRLHGVGPMGGTDLDAVLRNIGVTTIVGIGVSLNIGMLSFVLDAVNAGFDFVLPVDAVAGVPADYAKAVVDNTMSLLTTLTTTDALIDAWGAA